jgi:hypothetical protein
LILCHLALEKCRQHRVKKCERETRQQTEQKNDIEQAFEDDRGLRSDSHGKHVDDEVKESICCDSSSTESSSNEDNEKQ